MSDTNGSYFCYRCNRVVHGQPAASGIVCSVCQEGFIVRHDGPPPNNGQNPQQPGATIADIFRNLIPTMGAGGGGPVPQPNPLGPRPQQQQPPNFGIFNRPPRAQVTIRTHVYRPYGRPPNRPASPENQQQPGPGMNFRFPTPIINIINTGQPQPQPRIRFHFGQYQPNQQQPQFRPYTPGGYNVNFQPHPTFFQPGTAPPGASFPQNTETSTPQSGQTPTAPQAESQNSQQEQSQNTQGSTIYPNLNESQSNQEQSVSQPEQQESQQGQNQNPQGFGVGINREGNVFVVNGLEALTQLLNNLEPDAAMPNVNVNETNQGQQQPQFQQNQQQQQQQNANGQRGGTRFIEFLRNLMGGNQNNQQEQPQQQGSSQANAQFQSNEQFNQQSQANDQFQSNEQFNQQPQGQNQQGFTDFLRNLGPPNTQIHIEIDGADINMGDGNLGDILGNIGGEQGGGNFGELIAQLIQRLSGEPVQVGISQEDLNRLPMVKVNQKHVDNETQCVTCMETFKLDEEVVELDCKHIFHKPCLLPWLQGHRTCPICRTEINPSTWPGNNSSQNNERSRGFVDNDDLD